MSTPDQQQRLAQLNAAIHSGERTITDAKGASGFPDLTDKEWRWGGDAASIKPTLAGDKILLYADAGVNPNPTAEQLVDITLATIQTHKALVGGQARK